MLYEGNSRVTGGFPWKRPVTQSFDVFFDLRLNKQLSKPSRRRWFETHRAHYDVTAMSHLDDVVMIINRKLSWCLKSDPFLCSALVAQRCQTHHEGIRQYNSSNTGELDRHAQHQQPCLASRTPRVVVRQKQPVYQGHTALRSCTVRCQ